MKAHFAYVNSFSPEACPLEISKKKLIPVGLLRHTCDITILCDFSFN